MADAVDVHGSILDTTKIVLGIPAEYTAFDLAIMTHINSAFSTLKQLGVGPDAGFVIEDNGPKWSDLIGSRPDIQMVKSYVNLRVRLLWDPPQTGFGLDAIKSQITELEWRMNVSEDKPNFELPSDSGVLDDIIYNVSGDADFPPEAPVGAMGIDLATGRVYRKV